MHPLLTKRINVEWLRKPVFILWGIFLVLLVYILSFGPALRLCGAKPCVRWDSLPRLVQFMYGPLDSLVPAKFNNAYDDYLKLWVDIDH
jgi:hypothetical protein